jgi:hypothetical protein
VKDTPEVVRFEENTLLVLVLGVLCGFSSQSQSHISTDGQSVCLPW